MVAVGIPHATYDVVCVKNSYRSGDPRSRSVVATLRLPHPHFSRAQLSTMGQWFSRKASAGGDAFQECVRILIYLVSNDTSPAFAAEAILSSVCTSLKPSDVRFTILTLLLYTVAEFSELHDAIINPLFAIRDIPPSANPVYCYLDSMLRENCDSLSRQ